MKNILFLIFIYALGISCKKDETSTDKDLYNEISEGDYTYYQNGDILSAASASPHGSFKLRFNKTAQDALDNSGELPSGNSFPDGSVIVKELYSNGTLNLYAIMKKDASNKNAGSGWLWSEYKTDGSTLYSISDKGGSCISCHSSGTHRDLVRTFDLH